MTHSRPAFAPWAWPWYRCSRWRPVADFTAVVDAAMEREVFLKRQ